MTDGRSITRRRVVRQLLDWGCDPVNSQVICARGGMIGMAPISWWHFEITSWKGNYLTHDSDQLASGFALVSQRLDELDAKRPPSSVCRKTSRGSHDPR